MLESLGLSEQDVMVIASAVGTFVAAIFISIRGAKKGRPTSAAVAAAVEAAAPACRASADLGPTLKMIVDRLQDIEDVQRRSDERLVRLEDRTRRG